MANKKIPDLTANTNPTDAALYEVDDVGVSGKVLNTDIGQLRKVGTALIGGDFTGNARGDYAVDISTHRNQTAQVASGNYSIAVGNRVKASGYKAIALGYGAAAVSYYSVALGPQSSTGGQGAIAAGYNSEAGGDYAMGIGPNSKADGTQSIAIGYHSHTEKHDAVDADHSIAIGKSAHAIGSHSIMIGTGGAAVAEHSLAIGYASNARASQSNAIGKSAEARIAKTTVIVGPPIATKGDGAGTPGVEFTAPEMVLFSDELDLTAVADVTLNLPVGARFWPNELGVICTAVDTLAVQPTIRYGISGTLAKQKAAAITTLLSAVFKREKFTPLVPQDGETSLTAGVTVGATATVMKGRFYWKGVFAESQDFAGYSSGEIGNVDASTVVITFTENVNAAAYDAGVTIVVNGVAAVINSATRQANHAIVRYVLSAPVVHGDAVQFVYAKSLTPITSDSGVELANIALGGGNVTNNVP